MYAIRSTFVGRNIRFAASKISNRHMGGGGGAAKEWTGIDKVVRGYFPEDYQMAGAIMGGYGALISFFVLKSKFSKKPVEAAVVTAPVATNTTNDAIPSVESNDFANFIESEENLMKWVATSEQ